MEAVAKGADHATAPAKAVQTLGEKLGAAGLSVGSRHSHHSHFLAGLAKEATGDLTHQRCQVIHRQNGNSPLHYQSVPAPAGLSEHSSDPLLDRIIYK